MTKVANGYTLVQGVGIELILTFCLVFVIVATTDGNRTDFGSVSLKIGLTVAMLHFSCVSGTLHIVTFLKRYNSNTKPKPNRESFNTNIIFKLKKKLRISSLVLKGKSLKKVNTYVAFSNSIKFYVMLEKINVIQY